MHEAIEGLQGGVRGLGNLLQQGQPPLLLLGRRRELQEPLLLKKDLPRFLEAGQVQLQGPGGGQAGLHKEERQRQVQAAQDRIPKKGLR